MWCGFDEEMRSGIVEYANGIAQAIRKKASATGVSDLQQIVRERYELSNLQRIIVERLSNCGDSEEVKLKLEAFVGMVAIARFLIEEPNAIGALNCGFVDRASHLGGLIEEFDRYFETLPIDLDHSTNATATLTHVIPELEFLGNNISPRKANRA